MAGECEADAGCVAAGCSGEICVASASAGDLMSSCEIMPCFSALDSCRCQEGLCRWTIKEAAGLPGSPVPRPTGKDAASEAVDG